MNDLPQLRIPRAQHQHVLERRLRVGGAEQDAVVADVAVDHRARGCAGFGRLAGLHRHGEIHPRVAGADMAEEVLVAADLGRKIGDVEAPGHVLVLGEVGLRGGDVDIAEMRRGRQRLVKDDLGKADLAVEAVEPLVRLLAGVLESLAGPLRHLLLGQVAPFLLDPVILAADAPGSEEVGVGRLCGNKRLTFWLGCIVSEHRHLETEPRFRQAVPAKGNPVSRPEMRQYNNTELFPRFRSSRKDS